MTITLRDVKNLIDENFIDINDALDFLTEKGFIERKPYTGYTYYDKYGNFVATSDELSTSDLNLIIDEDDLVEIAELIKSEVDL